MALVHVSSVVFFNPFPSFPKDWGQMGTQEVLCYPLLPSRKNTDRQLLKNMGRTSKPVG